MTCLPPASAWSAEDRIALVMPPEATGLQPRYADAPTPGLPEEVKPGRAVEDANADEGDPAAAMPLHTGIRPLPPVADAPKPTANPSLADVPSGEFLSWTPPADVAALPPVDDQPLSGIFNPPQRRFYAFAEVLGLQRNNGAYPLPIVTDSVSGDTVFAANGLQPSFAMGGRAFIGMCNDSGLGFEAGYFGVYGMTAEQTLTGAGNLQLAGPLSTLVLPFQDADSVRAAYLSNINSAEFNVFRSCCSGAGGSDCDRCGQGCCIDWLGGFRYVSIEESLGLDFTCCTNAPAGPFSSSYDVLTSNNLFGGQLGGRTRRSWNSWAVEGWAKAGVFANLESQSQRPIVDPTGVGTVVRTGRGASGVEPAMMADLNLSVIYRISHVWGIRAGYNAMWIGGVALAPDQLDFSTATTAGTGLVGNGGIFLNGANIGLEARW